MSHFAKVVDNIVVEVIVADQDWVDGLQGTWVQTSYNTLGGVHYAPNSSTPDGGVALRKNYAGIGYTYDASRDAFYMPQPYPSWTLEEETCFWLCPSPYPDDGEDYYWNETNTQWELYMSQFPPAPDDGEDYRWDDESEQWVKLT
jgi:hypothetical protein|tara:strand:- start:715 stop:1149 length:435 start_codon:yes stop_codon:yes gene_type:complete